MNYREKYIIQYLSIIEDNKNYLNEKEKYFYENIKRLHELGRVVSSHQYNWLKDIAEKFDGTKK